MGLSPLTDFFLPYCPENLFQICSSLLTVSFPNHFSNQWLMNLLLCGEAWPAYIFLASLVLSQRKRFLPCLKQAPIESGSLPILLHDSTSLIIHNYSFILKHLPPHVLYGLLTFYQTKNNLTLLPILVIIYDACICFCSVPNFLTSGLCPLSLLNVVCSGLHHYLSTKVVLAQHCPQFLSSL